MMVAVVQPEDLPALQSDDRLLVWIRHGPDPADESDEPEVRSLFHALLLSTGFVVLRLQCVIASLVKPSSGHRSASSMTSRFSLMAVATAFSTVRSICRGLKWASR